MSQLSTDCKCDLKYQLLSPIDIEFFRQIKHIFILTKFYASDVIFVTNSGDVFGFGSNRFGRLGLGHDKEVPKPVPIKELCGEGVARVEFGEQFMVALTESMDVFTCGHDSDGMLGNRNDSRRYVRPRKLFLANGRVVDIKCCANSTFLLTDTKEVYHFGYGYFGHSLKGFTPVPTLNPYLKNIGIIAISCGRDHTLALTDAGRVYTSGHNNYGQLGNKYDKTGLHLIPLPENVFVKQISCGYKHSLLLTTEGQIYSFGLNCLGQLGTTDFKKHLSPQLIKSEVIFTEVFAFENTSMAMSEANEVFLWGYLRRTNLSSPLPTNEVSFQEAINKYSANVFTYKPLSGRQVFNKKPINQTMKTMTKAFNDQTFSDLKFKLKHKGSEDFDYIYGHKWFIANTSEYFERMFANQWSENINNELQINGYSYEAFYQFVRCLYTDSIETEDTELLTEVMGISDEYLNEEIKTKCVQIIKPLMNRQNVGSFYTCALRFRSQELEQLCYKFM